MILSLPLLQAREPDGPEHRGPEQLAEAACDLCSDFSEDESVSNSVTKTAKNKASDSRKATLGAPSHKVEASGADSIANLKGKSLQCSKWCVSSPPQSAWHIGNPPPMADARRPSGIASIIHLPLKLQAVNWPRNRKRRGLLTCPRSHSWHLASPLPPSTPTLTS